MEIEGQKIEVTLTQSDRNPAKRHIINKSFNNKNWNRNRGGFGRQGDDRYRK